MAVLRPEIFKDAHDLVSLYKNNLAFRERFDMAIERNVNVAFKHRPLKLYFEILASVNKAKFGDAYKEIRGLVRHDREGIIKKTLLEVSQKDLHELTTHAKKSEDNINSTTYPDSEIEKINKAEGSATPAEKQKAHEKRLEETTFLGPFKKSIEEEKKVEVKEKIIPGEAPEHKKTYQPIPEEEIPIRHIYIEPARQIIEEAPVEVTEIPVRETGPALPNIPVRQPLSFAKSILSKETTAGAARAGTIAAEAGAKTVARLGVGTAVKAGGGMLAKLGASAVAGVGTGGIGFVVGAALTLASTFPDAFKRLMRELAYAVVAVMLLFVFMSMNRQGMNMNAFLPPYKIAEAALPTTPSPTAPLTPTPTPSVPAGVTARCPVSGGTISCGSVGTNYSACPGGHCSPTYRRQNPGLCEAYPATAYGMDILASAGSPVYIPTVKNPATGTISNVTCSFVYSEVGYQGQTIIQYKCSIDGDTASPRNYFYIQFHHLRNQIPPGPYQTGSIAGYVWDSGDHTHVQIGLNGVCQGASTSSCVAPESYLQCR